MPNGGNADGAPIHLFVHFFNEKGETSDCDRQPKDSPPLPIWRAWELLPIPYRSSVPEGAKRVGDALWILLDVQLATATIPYSVLLVYTHLGDFGLGQNTYLSIALYSPGGLYDPDEQITQVGYCLCGKSSTLVRACVGQQGEIRQASASRLRSSPAGRMACSSRPHMCHAYHSSGKHPQRKERNSTSLSSSSAVKIS
jgi:hypothetical protein